MTRKENTVQNAISNAAFNHFRLPFRQKGAPKSAKHSYKTPPQNPIATHDKNTGN